MIDQAIDGYTVDAVPTRFAADLAEPAALMDIEQSIAECFEQQVERTPHRLAVSDEQLSLTYEELNRLANRLAHTLHSDAAGRVIVCIENGSTCVAAIIGVLKAGHAYVPVDPAFPESRNTYIVEDSQATVVVTNSRNLEMAENLSAGNARVINIDTLPAGSDHNPEIDISPDALAYIVYTSGSTGKPKGVMQNQRNTLHGCMRRTRLQRVTVEDRMTLFYSCSVMGSVYCIFGALLNGAALFPYDFRERGVDALGEWLADHRITIYHSVASVFRQFAASYPRGSAALRVRLAVFGGERVLTSDVELAREVFGHQVEFYTGLGSTETGTIRYFYIGPKTELDDATVPIGYPVEGMEIVLRGDDGQPVGVGEIGEITVRSPYLALGYWNNAEATAKVFEAAPDDSQLRTYRTGDMGELRADGLLQHRGRKDFQVKIRGFRVEVGEVETALHDHPGISEAAVVAREIGDEQQLVAYLVTEAGAENFSVRSLRQRLQRRLPYYMTPTIFVRLDAMPRTPNNKVDRLALPAPLPGNLLQNDIPVPAVDDVELGLLEIASDLLRAGDVGTNHNFFDLGGHSLSATRLIARVQHRFGVRLDMRQVFEAPDFKAIAEIIRDADSRVAGITPRLSTAPRLDRQPVSLAQRRMWLVDMLSKGNSAYNISNTVRLDGSLDVAALERALSEIVERHEVLRTRFPQGEREPWQEVLPAAPMPLDVIDLSDLPTDEQEARWQARAKQLLQHQHDLERGPLFQSALLRLGPESAILVLVFNHIVYDNIWSSGIFFRELGALYSAFASGEAQSPLAPLAHQFADYAVWERERASNSQLESQIAYWKQQLANLPEPLQVPGDHLRPDMPSLKGGQVAFQVPSDLANAIADFARAESATTFMALMACWQMLLHRYSQQDDILIGTPTGRRYLAETEDMIGLFINNLVLRARFTPGLTFRGLLAQMRQVTIDAFSNDELPFEDLVAELEFPRSRADAPLFQHLFIHRNNTHSRWEIPGLRLSRVPLHTGGSKYDLTLSMLEEGERMSGTLEYSSDLFEHASAERIAAHYIALMGRAIENPDIPVAMLDMLDAAEREALLHDWNPPATQFPELHPHQLVEQQAAVTPDAPAVIGENVALTYAALNARANRMAARLRGMGVGPGELVAVCMERSPDLVVALLAVMKTGGAYVPLDPTFPVDRLHYMVENSRAKVCISQPGVVDRLGPVEAETVLLEANDPRLEEGDASDQPPTGSLDDLAYVIYTSGSTGRPKGVQVVRRGLVNFLESMRHEPGIGRSDVLHSLTTICFDIAALELFLPLICGAQVVIKSQKLALDPELLLASMEETGTTIMQATPVTWRMLLDQGWRGDPPIKVLCGGEAMSLELAGQLVATGCEVWNLYGPTETTIWSSVRRVRAQEDAINLGYPIANTSFLICSPDLELQPVGVPGELLIGGDGLARGYFALDEMTREKFIDHPFAPGERLYRTGDLVVRQASGDIRFLGRIDNQVKLRGFRIELGDIETHLEAHPAVKQCVVVARNDKGGEKRLVAYLLASTGETIDVDALRSFARERMPDYMIPSSYMGLETLPLTPNGKVDRKALPDPTYLPDLEAVGSDYVAPGNETEKILAHMWMEILAIDKVSITDSFQDLGGTSLSAASLMVRIRAQFGYSFSPDVLLQAPTIQRIAEAINQHFTPVNTVFVPLRRGAPGSPVLLLVAGAGGHVFSFLNFARALPFEATVYGLKPFGVDDIDELPTTFEAIAAKYVAELENICPEGPVIASGYSMGARVAFEIARQLESLNKPLLGFISMDMPAPGFPPKQKLASKFLDRLRVIRSKSWRDILTRGFAAAKKAVRSGDRLFAGELKFAMSNWDIIPDHGMEEVFPRLWEANRIYRPQYRLRAPLIFVRRPLPTKATYGDGMEIVERGWGEFSEGDVDVRIMMAGHLEMFLGEKAKALARIVGDALGLGEEQGHERQEFAPQARVLTPTAANR
ncbi:non-ribosomal peptide synthetase [Tsuneonella mangrovi]|uniref:non-ribosomal peptide synthetase n=1 Tax=Tsuneonella mangrovi TaxID=1982042 RepID=UPI001471D478|nr:non-ribosomal peptide synthetase [Tsuneonella mangrovi]